jgi:Fe-S-cluster-containing dehydrogenase component
MQFSFLFDASRCTSCHTCEIACKQENALPPLTDAEPGSTGPHWRRVTSREEGVYPNARVWYTSISEDEKCNMCLGRLGNRELPACVASCPGGAIQLKSANGLVAGQP